MAQKPSSIAQRYRNLQPSESTVLRTGCAASQISPAAREGRGRLSGPEEAGRGPVAGRGGVGPEVYRGRSGRAVPGPR